MAAIQCKVEIPEGPGLKDGQLTVGREFLLNCQGEFPQGLKTENLQFVLEPSAKYVLKLLNFEFRSPSEADLKVTSYTAADVNLPQLQLSDGMQTLELGSVNFKLVSVLPPPSAEESQPGQQPKPPEPYGPVGPAHIAVPDLYIALVCGVLILILTALSLKIYRVVQRKKILEKLKEHDSALAPSVEFFTLVRQLQRKNTVFFGGQAEPSDVPLALETLNTGFKRYLTREFKIPALEWSDRLILKDLKSYHRKTYNELSEEIKRLLHEFTQAQKDLKKISEIDVLKISTQTQGLIDKIERGLK